MMLAGFHLRQDTETTLPELPEQHRIREKEEELHGLESVHMAESETKCTAPGLNTLAPECVTANSRVSDLHYTEASLIKTEAALSPSNTGDLKTESLDFTELAYVTHLYPDQIKTETDNGGCVKAEHMSVLPDKNCFDIKSEVKLESSDVLVSDLMNTELNGAAIDEKGQTKPWQCAGEPNPNCKKSGGKMLVHGGEKLYKCDQCEKSFIYQSSFKYHQRIHSGEKPYKCDQCEECFSWSSQLKSHKSIHTGEKAYKCDQCEKSFVMKSKLKYHQSIHTGEKPYKCDQCEKSFSWKCQLKSHQSIHTVEKHYKCDQCQKSFSWKCQIKSHKCIHTGEKPYKCDQCEKSFLSKALLKYHHSIHSGEKPLKCDRCEKSFVRKYH
ncbi:hypothetical protein GJAV_G00088350, partial [Gymnothorax javanicus]